MNPTLHTLQHRFKKALQTEARLNKDQLSALETPLVPFQTRIGIYQYAYHARIIEALESDFPRLQKRIGKKE